MNGIENKFPANLMKFDVYTETVNSKKDAIDLAIERKLVYGEPAVITYYTDSSIMDASTTEMLLAIGGAEPEHPYFTIMKQEL